MKKGVFTVMHYLMPKRGILSLHSGCNMGKDKDVSLFFGLSGEHWAVSVSDSFTIVPPLPRAFQRPLMCPSWGVNM